MFDWFFMKKEKEVVAEYEADLTAKEAVAAHEAELNTRLAERLKYYNPKEDDSVSTFSEIDFNENDDHTIDLTAPDRTVDVWGIANPGETSQWNKENRRKSEQRQGDRRDDDRRRINRRK